MSDNAWVLLSGGIDSAACAYFLRDLGYRVNALFIDYGQKAAHSERSSAEMVSQSLGIQLITAALVAQPQFEAGEITGRNAFLILACLMASQIKMGVIAMGIHSGTRYYDCSTAFADSMDRLLSEHTDGCVRLLTPFVTWNKKNIVDYYLSKGLSLDMTYSCERGEVPPCGRCLSCLDRRALGC